jgi:hypothetical protein
MPPDLAGVHILAMARLRRLAERAVAARWEGLGSYDERDVERFLEPVVPIVLAAQQQAVRLTDAYLARALERQPLGIPADLATGAAVRAGTTPAEVYRRPFVTTWAALANGAQYQDAVAAGLARAKSTAATDVQLAMRQTLTLVGEADERITGYQRVPDGGACAFCRLVAGQRYTTRDLMPIHSHCGCGVQPILSSERDRFTGRRDNDLDLQVDQPVGPADGVQAVVREHGELGPVLVDARHTFTAPADLAA